MDILKKVNNTIKRYAMLYGGERVLIALSGGPDSVCLLHLLHELRKQWKISLEALYVDHGLRPDETEREKRFCKEIAERLGVGFNTVEVDVRTYAEREGLSLQEAARVLRYHALEQEAIRTESDRIATGHHADDQAETVVMRLIRGSGRRGLSGIPPVRGKIIRPLIEVQKTEIERYLQERGLKFLTDSSNLKKDYLRNRIRQEVIPVLKRFNPNLTKTLSRVASVLREEDEYLDIQVAKALMRLISRKSDKSVELFLSPLETMERVILRRALLRVIDETRGLREIGVEHIEEIIRLIQEGSTGARIYLPGGIRVIKSYSTLTITSQAPERVGEYTLNVPGETVVKEAGLVLISSITAEKDNLGDGRYEVSLDLDSLSFPLRIRARQKGDYFYPFGFGKRKKLQDFFVDEKVPRDVRDSVPIIVSGDDIVWVVGYRLDDRFKVLPSTRRVLKIIARVSRLR